MKNKLKRNSKDSVFTAYFKIKENAYKAYQSLYQDATITKEDIEVITLDPIITNGIYNDLALIVKNKLMIFIEEQSTWSPNLVWRYLFYYVQTLKEYFYKNSISLHTTRKIRLPIPEFYCVYTGKSFKKNTYSLMKDFFGLKSGKFDLIVDIIHKENKADYGIFKEYLRYAEIFNETVKKMGYTMSAAKCIVNKCIEEDCLKDFMIANKVEVLSMIESILSQEWVDKCERENQRIKFEKLKSAHKSELNKQRIEFEIERNDALNKQNLNTARKLKEKGIPIKDIIEITSLSEEVIQNL